MYAGGRTSREREIKMNNWVAGRVEWKTRGGTEGDEKKWNRRASV